MHKVDRLVDHLFREQAGKLGAVLTRIFGFEHASLSEDVVQDTFLTALRRWPLDGIPDNPPAWLMQVARNKTLNILKRQRRSSELLNDGRILPATETVGEYFIEGEIRDSQLRVLIACCHTSLAEKARIILILRTVSGLSIPEIARALLSSEESVKKSLYRSRSILKNEEALQTDLNQLETHIGTILIALYLIFNEGYKSISSDSEIRKNLCFEAMRLGLLVQETLHTSSGPTNALLALFCFQMARFPARSDATRPIIDLQQQDRSLWDKELINRGMQFLKESREENTVSRYHLEAGIASLHCMASRWEDTDWKGILFYYDQLCEREPTPLSNLNRAIAISYGSEPTAGMEILDLLESPDSSYDFLLMAARGNIYTRMGEPAPAVEWYQKAIDHAPSEAVRSFLEEKKETSRIRGQSGGVAEE